VCFGRLDWPVLYELVPTCRTGCNAASSVAGRPRNVCRRRLGDLRVSLARANSHPAVPGRAAGSHAAPRARLMRWSSPRSLRAVTLPVGHGS